MTKNLLLILLFASILMHGCGLPHNPPKFRVGQTVYYDGKVRVTITGIDSFNSRNHGCWMYIIPNIQLPNKMLSPIQEESLDSLPTEVSRANTIVSDLMTIGINLNDKQPQVVYDTFKRESTEFNKVHLQGSKQQIEAYLFNTRMLIKGFITETKYCGGSIVYPPVEINARMKELDSVLSSEMTIMSQNMKNN